MYETAVKVLQKAKEHEKVMEGQPRHHTWLCKMCRIPESSAGSGGRQLRKGCLRYYSPDPGSATNVDVPH